MRNCNRTIFGVLNMNEIHGNIIDMEKEQLKAALKAIAKQHSISLSEVAKEAGVSPSTITGFLNDVPGRGHYGLSAKPQSKLAERGASMA